MLHTFKTKIAAGLFILGLSAGAAAGPITVDAGWTVFNFGGAGSSLSGEPFTFSLSTAGFLQVTDAFAQGDRFEIFDSVLGSLGLTSIPPAGAGLNIGNDYDAAFASSDWSSASFALTAGSYSITGMTTLSPFGGGDAALRVVSDVSAPVPAPATLALFGLGLAGLGWTRRKKA